jgi:branched-chain amino acid aminotransferase
MMAREGKQVWMDGRLVDFDDARVHVLSHTLHYGIGVFEGIRAYTTPSGPAVFRLPEHVRRLVTSARVYHMSLPWSEEEIAKAVVETVAANGIVPAYIRPLVYRGEPGLGVKNTTGKVSLAIAVIPAKKYLGEGSEQGVRATIASFRKPPSDAMPSYAKACGNYLTSYLAGVDAQQDGYDEAILLDTRGYVAEGTGENLFLVRGETIYTPGLESDILLGITRDTVIQLASDLGYTVVQKLISVNELLTADEAFFSGTFAELAPIREIGHQTVGREVPGPVTRSVMGAFAKAVRGEDPRYARWLTRVPSIVAAVAPRPRAVRR